MQTANILVPFSVIVLTLDHHNICFQKYILNFPWQNEEFASLEDENAQ